MSETNETITIETNLGKVKGVKRINALTKSDLYSFQGIPYAAPPVEDLRFKPPQPHSGWEDVLDATKEGGVCAQNDSMITMGIVGSDDCLYLNIYLSSISNDIKKPVMVFVHGGGFTFGHSSSMFYGPDFLVSRDIILVTVNYRVNIFGYLNFGLEDCRGNLGLRDLIASLKWIQQNISCYGGDKNNVTLFGESAGSASVHYLMMALPSKGLFHKAILQSGTSIDPWAYQSQKDNIINGLAVAKNLGCQETDLNLVLKFLKSIPALDLVKNQEKSVVTADKIRKSLVFPFVPCIETVGPFEERIVTDLPTVMLKQNPPSIPFIIGINSQESLILLLKNVHSIDKILSSLNNDFERVVPVNFNADEAKEKNIATDIKYFFFNDKPISLETVNEYFNLYSDLMFTLGHFETVTQSLLTGFNNAYTYLFSFEGTMNIFKNLMVASEPKISGASHVDELGYMFYVTMAQLIPESGSSEEKVSNNVLDLWTNFAKNGVPSTKTFTSWKPCERNSISYLNIDSELSIQPGFIFPKRHLFWKQLYSNYKLNFLKEKL